MSVNTRDTPEIVDVARDFHEIGFKIVATGKTHELITKAGIPAERVNKLYEGRPNILDLMKNGNIQLIVNSPVGKESSHDDSYLRKAAVKEKITYMTTIAAARAAAEGIKYIRENGSKDVCSLQSWHSEIKDNDL